MSLSSTDVGCRRSDTARKPVLPRPLQTSHLVVRTHLPHFPQHRSVTANAPSSLRSPTSVHQLSEACFRESVLHRTAGTLATLFLAALVARAFHCCPSGRYCRSSRTSKSPGTSSTSRNIGCVLNRMYPSRNTYGSETHSGQLPCSERTSACRSSHMHEPCLPFPWSEMCLGGRRWT